jgi:hypothetical protein
MLNRESCQKSEKDFCFATLALGKKYRYLALLLAEDLEKYSPNTSFVILTDNPREFSGRSNVLAFKHRQQGVKCWHDKRFVLAKALELFDTCIFINADMRILGDVSGDIEWLPGITARSGTSILKHNENRHKTLAIIKDLADKLDLKLEEVKWINEFLFTVKRDAGKEIEFLRLWEMMAPYFEIQGVHDGEGNAIGMAAVKAGLPLRLDSIDRFPFFNDRIEAERIKRGLVDPNEKLIYFEIQKKLEHPHQSKLEKLANKVSNKLMYFYRSLRLKVVCLRDFELYYLGKLKNQKNT